MATIQNKRASSKAKIEDAKLLAGEIALVTSGVDAGLGYVGVDGQTGTAVPFKAGKADEAAKLSTARNVSATGDVEATAVAFDGTADVSLATTIKDGVVTKAKLATALQTEIDEKVKSVTATAAKGIEIAGTATDPTIGIKIDAVKQDNALEVSADGLYVAQATAPEYTIIKATQAAADSVATYKLQKDGVDVAGSVINIPLDYLVKSADLKTSTGAGDPSGLPANHKYIDFVVNVKEGTGTESHLYLDVADLTDVYTSGSAADDAVVVAVSNDNKITATLTDGKILITKLEQDAQDAIALAKTAVQEVAAADKSIKVTDGGRTKSINVAVSTTVGNALVLDAEGLFVPNMGVTAGNGIDISADKVVSVKAHPTSANGLFVNAGGVGVTIASTTGVGVVKGSDEIAVGGDGALTVDNIDCGSLD